MNKIQIFFKSLKRRGIKNTFLIVLSYCIDHFFDIKYKTDTCSWVALNDLGVANNKKEHAHMYQQTHAVPLRKLFSKLKLPPDKILVDLDVAREDCYW